MNKQELIEHCESLKGDLNKFINGIDVNKIVKKIEQLDEPQKPVVPQFVADWIEQRKDEGWKLSQMFLQANLEEKYGRWIVDNQETFARAWLDGYTVEKEKRYYVRFKGMESGDFNYLNFIKFQHAWVLSSIKLDKKFRTEHTKKQLEEAGFGWVFDCEGIEIEEVEE
ncbi:MAG: DUF1642 domain-containing protein [Streptococcus parasanguinis]|nr:DUF1642 domain-containing protein [Streptococcus parasanguinis]